MERDNDKQQEVVLNGLYEAAVNPDGWPRAAHDLLRWVGADAILVVDGRAGKRRVVLASGHEQRFVDRYAGTWLQADPRLDAAGDGIGGAVDEVTLEACRALEREHGLHGCFADRLDLGADARHWALLYTRDAAAQSRVAIRYGRVRQHLQRALRLGRRQAATLNNGRALAEMADDMPLGVLLVDTNGRVRHSNLMARQVLDAEDSLKLRDGRLRALREGDDERLRTALREALEPDEDGETVTRWLSLPRRTGEPAYNLAVREAVEIDAEADAVTGTGRFLRVLIGDAGRLPEVSADALGTLFELTAREAQVCVRLLRGLCIEDTAADLGVSPRTARVYLQQVFLKLGVHRQADLVRLLMACPALLDCRTPADPGGSPPAEPPSTRRQNEEARNTARASLRPPPQSSAASPA